MGKNAPFWTIGRIRHTRENNVPYWEGRMNVNGVRFTVMVWAVKDSKTGEESMKVELWGAQRRRQTWRTPWNKYQGY